MRNLYIVVFLFLSTFSFAQRSRMTGHMLSFEAYGQNSNLTVIRLLDENKTKFKSGYDLGANLDYKYRITNSVYFLLAGGVWMPEFKAENETVIFDDSLITSEVGFWFISGLKSQISLTYKVADDVFGEEVGGVLGLYKDQVGVGRIKLTQYFAGRKELGFGINLAGEIGKGDRITSRSYFEFSLFAGSFSRKSSLHFELGGYSSTKKVQDSSNQNSFETADTGMFVKFRYGFGF